MKFLWSMIFLRVSDKYQWILFVTLRGSGEKECYFEWKMGPYNAAIEDGVFIAAWQVFCDELKQIQQK